MVEAFKRIMLPVDFSTHCGRAAEYAIWFASTPGATVHLVHVIVNPADGIYDPAGVSNWELVDHAERKAHSLLESVAQRCLPPNCPREYHVLHGDPNDKLMEAAKRIQPDVIVMSTHGRSGVAHLLIGSVAEKVVRNAPCPVFVVRRAA